MNDPAMNDLFADALQRVLTDHCMPAVVRAIEAGESPRALWQAIESAGFADALVPESAGGAGLTLPDVFSLWTLCGTHAVPVPLAETMMARALLAQARVAHSGGSIALAAGVVAADGTLRCAQVSAGRVADAVLVIGAGRAHLLSTQGADRLTGGFCLDATLTWPASLVAAGQATSQAFDCSADLRTMQGAIYAAQLAGAQLAVFERTLAYANDRVQFGRPIGKFQAIQHQLSVLAEEAFAARMAAQLGCQASGIAPARLRVAVAKARTSEAAVEVAALAHSIHGAIGFTAEFDLQLYTRRLHAWRQAGGAESTWHSVLGEVLVADSGRPALDLLRAATDR